MPETTPLPVLRWPCDLARPAPHRVQIFRGETVRLEALLTLNGASVEIPAGATATLAWQSPDMGGSWYTAAANIDAERGSVWADFGPEMDAGADEYRAFLRVDSDGACYRAVAALQILPSPGAVINEIPIPPRVLDFATIEVLNAPYWTKAEADARFASTADATLNGRGVDGSGFSEWTLSDYEDELHLELESDGWHLYLGEENGSDGKGDENSTSLSWTQGIDAAYTVTATRTALPGYVLGSQTEKPIPKLSDVPAVVAPSTDAADAGKAADAKATGDALAGKLSTSGGNVGALYLHDPETGATTAVDGGFVNVSDDGISETTYGATAINKGGSTNINLPSSAGTLALVSQIPTAETWTFEVDDGQGGTETVTKSVAVFAAQGGA